MVFIRPPPTPSPTTCASAQSPISNLQSPSPKSPLPRAGDCGGVVWARGNRRAAGAAGPTFGQVTGETTQSVLDGWAQAGAACLLWRRDEARGGVGGDQTGGLVWGTGWHRIGALKRAGGEHDEVASYADTAECQVPSAECRVPSAKCQVPSAKCQVPIGDC